MKRKKVLKSTSNRKVYNHVKKNYLYNYGLCDRCRYHRGCNKRVHYGGFINEKNENINYPSWKIVSKNRKQWMKKPLKKKVKKLSWRKSEYLIFEW